MQGRHFYDEGSGTLEEVAQRGGRCPIPGNIQGQAGHGSQQPDPFEDVPAYWDSTRWLWKVPSNPNYHMIYDLQTDQCGGTQNTAGTLGLKAQVTWRRRVTQWEFHLVVHQTQHTVVEFTN